MTGRPLQFASGRTLAIDCATKACSVALFENDSLIGGELRMLGRGHAEALIPMIASLPERGWAQRIVVSVGPGSFTGVRVGLAAARALALAWGSELAGYSSLPLIAAMARETHGAQPVGVAMTGGHGEWFIQGFDAQGSQTRPLASLRPEVAVAATTEETVVGDQAEALVAARGSGQAVALWPDARAVRLLPPSALLMETRPLYGRAPDARLPVGTSSASPA
ncbi:tRNA (adenosine(37)-N6)-threonylcarbamoyltransferase complex dimerization subunit type 1 TsaB [Novosphingobium sp.]|uniref:tRNA (adenosine(37)-N6)-threonylcarbamoyltransferase complex dimerization subunit type 1 TsaB n=1 Tax=Novosphingobium sp. TaxID=1874826 RepID=UPI002B488B07|nr:tRNA (adenosine(37)-N6)-threonylcarbamoyltransferase complex dimerization subunit type 1 TsaB [Novosphingobium sp.]HKR92560.1 tRNA (adenosine(37)-N6)-threonylcarbamoyltransferase complex dimerization subunit type 1 TsaB [Novosphingobium sp.]